MQYKAKTIQLSAASGGLYEAMLFRWDELDAHNDRFVRDAEVIVHTEPPIFVEHDYTRPPVGKIVQLSDRDDGMYVYVKLFGSIEGKDYLSVGGFAYEWKTNDSGGMDITKFVVLEASLTATPAQKNTPLLQLKNNIAMAYLTKQEGEQILARLEEVAAEIVQVKTRQGEHESRLQALEAQLAALTQANGHIEEKTKSLLDETIKKLTAQQQEFSEVNAKAYHAIAELIKKLKSYGTGN